MRSIYLQRMEQQAESFEQSELFVDFAALKAKPAHHPENDKYTMGC